MTFLRSLSDDVRILLILAAFWLPVMLMYVPAAELTHLPRHRPGL